MNTSDCYYLGYIAKTFGYKGAVSLFLDVDDPTVYNKMESVLILLGGKLVPFFIDSLTLRPNSREANVHFQGIDSDEKAALLCGKEIYLPLQYLPELSGNNFYFHEIEGYEAIDKKLGSIGIVERVIDLPGNPLFLIKKDFREILIPVRDEFILKVDRENRQLLLDAPDGLIDIYLDTI
jgi:16S rRNA processing protein RimM